MDLGSMASNLFLLFAIGDIDHSQEIVGKIADCDLLFVV